MDITIDINIKNLAEFLSRIKEQEQVWLNDYLGNNEQGQLMTYCFKALFVEKTYSCGETYMKLTELGDDILMSLELYHEELNLFIEKLKEFRDGSKRN
jgi:hypothetical protein